MSSSSGGDLLSLAANKELLQLQMGQALVQLSCTAEPGMAATQRQSPWECGLGGGLWRGRDCDSCCLPFANATGTRFAGCLGSGVRVSAFPLLHHAAHPCIILQQRSFGSGLPGVLRFVSLARLSRLPPDPLVRKLAEAPWGGGRRGRVVSKHFCSRATCYISIHFHGRKTKSVLYTIGWISNERVRFTWIFFFVMMQDKREM